MLSNNFVEVLKTHLAFQLSELKPSHRPTSSLKTLAPFLDKDELDGTCSVFRVRVDRSLFFGDHSSHRRHLSHRMPTAIVLFTMALTVGLPLRRTPRTIPMPSQVVRCSRKMRRCSMPAESQLRASAVPARFPTTACLQRAEQVTIRSSSTRRSTESPAVLPTRPVMPTTWFRSTTITGQQ